MKNKMGKVCLLFGISLCTMASAQAKCGSVTIASMNWQSSDVLSNLDKFILENGYDCSVSVITSDTVPAFTSMVEKDKPDIASEGWVDLVPEVLQRGLDDKKLIVTGNALADGGQQGWFIPKYIIDAHPDIKTVSDALKHPELFPSPEDPSKGAIYNAPQGYGGAVVTAQLYKAYQAEKAGFILIDSGSAAGLDGSMSRAYENKQGWLGFYWEPTSMLGRYEMVRLMPEISFDEAEWKRCTANPQCPDPKPNSWPVDRVQTVVTASFANRVDAPVMDYLKTRSWQNDTVNALLAWMTENQATGDDGARYFLQNHSDIWKKWVSEDAAKKIERAL